MQSVLGSRDGNGRQGGEGECLEYCCGLLDRNTAVYEIQAWAFHRQHVLVIAAYHPFLRFFSPSHTKENKPNFLSEFICVSQGVHKHMHHDRFRFKTISPKGWMTAGREESKGAPGPYGDTPPLLTKRYDVIWCACLPACIVHLSFTFKCRNRVKHPTMKRICCSSPPDLWFDVRLVASGSGSGSEPLRRRPHGRAGANSGGQAGEGVASRGGFGLGGRSAQGNRGYCLRADVRHEPPSK